MAVAICNIRKPSNADEREPPEMQIVTKDAEEKILREVESARRQHAHTRCLRLALSQASEKERRAINAQALHAAIAQTIDDDEGRIYLCEDGDLFAFAQLLTWKKLDFLAAHLTPELPPARFDGLAALFDVTVDAEKIAALCHEKIRAIKNRREQEDYDRTIAQQRARIEKVRELLGSPTTPQLRDYIARQRSKRGKTTLMIADDDAFSRRMVGNALKDTFDMHLAEDGESALLSYVEFAPDILFLDIEMPDMSGHEVLKKVFDLDPDAYVVMFSGNGNRENVMKAVETGAKGFVGKPFTREKLLHYIEKCRASRNGTVATAGKEEHSHGYA